VATRHRLLKRGQALLDHAHLVAERGTELVDLMLDLDVLATPATLLGFPLRGPNEHPARRVRDENPLSLEQVDSPLGGIERYPVRLCERPARWQPLTCLVLPLLDGTPKIVCHLDVRRAWIVLAHYHSGEASRLRLSYVIQVANVLASLFDRN